MGKRFLSVLLAVSLLLQGSMWAAAEETVSDADEWMTKDAENSIQTETLPVFEEEGSESDGLVPGEVPGESDLAAEGPLKEEEPEEDVFLNEEDQREETLTESSGQEEEDPAAGKDPAAGQNPETEQDSEGEASDGQGTLAEETDMLAPGEGDLVLTIDAVEEVELLDMDAYMPDEISGAPVTIDAQHFPDSIFRTYVNGLDMDKDGVLSAAEAAAVTDIEIKGVKSGNDWKVVSSLAGIEYFTSLRTLNCSQNQLATLDLSQNTELTKLDCSYNKLEALDVSRNAKLAELDYSSNNLPVLDLSGNPNLTVLSCSANRIEKLDPGRYTALTKLNCSQNKLTALDVSGNPALTELNCSNNPGLTTLDTGENAALSVLICSNNKMGSLDVSKNPALTVLECGNNKLTSLNIGQNTELVTLNCTNNQLTSLDMSRSPKLAELSCTNNQLTKLDVSQNRELTNLNCGSNRLTNLDLRCTSSLVTLFCDTNSLTSLDVSPCGGLETLSCSSNQLTGLTIGQGAALADLYCENNQLTSLDVSGYSKMRALDCANNRLTSLVIGKHSALNYIECQNNQLTDLDVSEDSTLQNFVCSSNQLTKLDLTKNRYISWLDCSDNRIETLDLCSTVNPQYGPLTKQIFCENNRLRTLELPVDSCKVLETLNCTGNQLESLNVSGCPNLTGLDCEENLLSSLDVSANSSLQYLFCGSNPLMSLDLSKNSALIDLKCDSLEREILLCSQSNSREIALAEMMKEGDLSKVAFTPGSAFLQDGVIGFSGSVPDQFSYQYDTVASSSSPGVSKKITVTLKLLPHRYGEVVEKAATCAQSGSRYRDCTACGYRETVAVLPATGVHKYGKYVVVRAATAVKNGLKRRTCSVCGGIENKATAKLKATIKLSASSILLTRKQSTDKLTVSGLAKGDSVVSWKSGNTKIVTVKSTGNKKKCTLTAKNKIGSAYVTVTLASGLKKKIKVAVQKAEVATRKISGLKNMTLSVGEKVTLKPVITPITSVQKVTYQTSDKKTASVSAKGVVKALKTGTAKITVKSGNKKIVIKVNIKKSKK